MGVPGLYPWISEIYSEEILQFVFNNDLPEEKLLEMTFKIQSFMSGVTDALYIDGNAIIHPIMQHVFNYGEKKRLKDPYSKLTYENKLTKSFELFFEYIIKIIDVMQPTKIIYLAIDGPAPLAKMAQQRQRRFVSSSKAVDANSNTPPFWYEVAPVSDMEFNPNGITPGTEFMYSLFKFLRYRIRLYLNEVSNPHLKFILSQFTNPGEGEHKIMDYIRSISDNLEIKNHVFFGPDGDLIMLTLSAAKILDGGSNMFLLREDSNTVNGFNLLNMTKIYEQMTSENISLGEIKMPVEDFILIGFFVGNDFLPKIQMFMYLKDGLNTLVRKMMDMKLRITVNSSGDEYYINLPQFTELIRYLKDEESNEIRKQAGAKPQDPRFINHTLLKAVKLSYRQDDSAFVKPKDFNFELYRKLYYKKEPNLDSVRNLSLEYIKTMNWILKYYMEGLPSWDFHYKYHYPPLMVDLFETLNTLTIPERNYILNFEESKPIIPFVQLLSVLPKSYALKLLPDESNFKEMVKKLPKEDYPDKFEIDFEGKTKEHFGIVLLPFIDIHKIEKIYDKYAPDLVYQRNTLTKGNGELYQYYTEDYQSKYKNEYGIIPVNKVYFTILKN